MVISGWLRPREVPVPSAARWHLEGADAAAVRRRRRLTLDALHTGGRDQAAAAAAAAAATAAHGVVIGLGLAAKELLLLLLLLLLLALRAEAVVVWLALLRQRADGA